MQCTGHFPDKPLLYRCWIYKQFNTTHSVQLEHDLNGSDAIQCSCGIFFFQMGKRLGVDRIRSLYRAYAVGNDSVPFNRYGMPSLPTDLGERKREAARRVFVNLSNAGERWSRRRRGRFGGDPDGDRAGADHLDAAARRERVCGHRADGSVRIDPRLSPAPMLTKKTDLHIPSSAVASGGSRSARQREQGAPFAGGHDDL